MIRDYTGRDMAEELKQMTQEFRVLFSQEPNVKRAQELIREEATEVLNASIFSGLTDWPVFEIEDYLKEVADFLYVMAGCAEQVEASGEEPEWEEEDVYLIQLVTSVIDRSLDIFLSDDMVFEAVERVHQSNMSKLGEDGLPIFREDGKVLKGPNYMEPDLRDIAEVAADNYHVFHNLMKEVEEEAA